MFPTPLQMMTLSIRTATMLAEAQMVIAMRLLGMAGMWRVSPSENARMVSEKMDAVQQSAFSATRAVMQGKSPAAIADVALKPISRRTSANAKRLARRGPGTP
ncbi:antifreeze protein [Tabrizicola thermarum]|uniref:antifreeze protein n=1 Tax=Tabrizicola thermarum TaxID=2670345 RepID=UPI000FFB1299|nr:antifreeze protein [Tabrizicola thermarum]